MNAVTIIKLADLQPGDLVRAWEDGDPWSAIVASITPRVVQRYTTDGEIQWVYDVAYEHGHIAYTQDGDSLRKVVRS